MTTATCVPALPMLKKSTTFLTKFFTRLKLYLPTLPELSRMKAKSTEVWQTLKKKSKKMTMTIMLVKLFIITIVMKVILIKMMAKMEI